MWAVTRWEGTPQLCQMDEHNKLGWFSVGELADLELADDRYLELPRRVLLPR
jgi:hypothetical protein